MSLYQKHRPRTFEEMVGNESQIKSFEKEICKRNGARVFLLSGPPGTGKTTLARIAASRLNAGELSIVEINSANNRGIDTARQIIDQMRYLPTDGDVMVFIIDEVHQTSKDWQNAMLKPLEDTPEYVYFFLCTTDSQKLIPAIRSRCTEIKTNVLNEDDMLLLLRKVNRAGAMGVEKNILEEIMTVSQGSPRKALVLLERVAVLDTKEEQEQLIKGECIEEEIPEVLELCRALLKEKNWAPVAKIIKKLLPNVEDTEKVRYAVLGYMNSVLLNGADNTRAAIAMEYFSEPFYNTNKTGITLAAYQTLFAGE